MANAAPSITSSDIVTVSENSSENTVIYNTEAFDEDNDNLTYSISGTDAEYFTINSENGEVFLKTPADYETKAFYVFEVSVSDGELSGVKSITLNVTDIEENNSSENDTSSLLVYAYGASSAPGLTSYKDLYGILIDPDTGDLLGQEVQLTNQIGHEVAKYVLPTDNGGFKILYAAADMVLRDDVSYISYVGRDKTILATYDQNLNLIDESIGDRQIINGEYTGIISEDIFTYRHNGDYGDSSIAIHNFSTDVTSFIDWEKDQSTGLGNDPVIYDLVSLSDTSSLLVYAYGASSAPGLTSYKDLYGILIDPDTGDLLGQEVNIGHEVAKYVLPTDNGGFKILYAAADMVLRDDVSYISYVGRDKTILATYDQNLNLIDESIGDRQIINGEYTGIISEDIFTYRHNGDYGDSSIAIHNFSTDVTSFIDWEKDQSTGLGNDPVIYDLVSLSDTSSLLVYAYGASSAPGLTSYKDLYGILIDPDTGDLLGQEVQLTNQIGHEVAKYVLPTDNGGFKILYAAADMVLRDDVSYISYVGRDKTILATYDQNLNLIDESIGDRQIINGEYTGIISEDIFTYRHNGDYGDSSIAIHNFSTDVTSFIDWEKDQSTGLGNDPVIYDLVSIANIPEIENSNSYITFRCDAQLYGQGNKGAFLVSSPDHDGFVVNSSNFILDLEQAEVVPLSADDTYLAVWRMKDPDNETQYGENIDTYIRVFDSAGNFLTDEVSLAGLGIDYDNEIEDIMDVQTLSNGDAAIYMRERSSNNNNSQDIIYQVDSSDYSVSWDVYSWTVTDDYGNNWESTLGTQNTSNLVVHENSNSYITFRCDAQLYGQGNKGAFLVSSPDHDGFVVNSSNFILDLEQAEVVPLSADNTYLAVWRMKDPDNETQYGENIDTYIRVFDSAGNFLTDEISLAGLGIDYDNEIEDIMDVQTLSNGDAAIYMRERSSNNNNNNSQDIIYQVDSSDYSVSWDVYSWTVTDDYGNNWESTLGTQNTSNLVVHENSNSYITFRCDAQLYGQGNKRCFPCQFS